VLPTSGQANGFRGTDIQTIKEGSLMTVDVATRVKDKVVDAQQAVHIKADGIKQQIGAGTATLQDKAAEAASQAKNLTDRVRGKVPPQMAARIEPVMATARQRSLPTAVIAVAVLLVLLRLVLRRLLGRNS
jgi:predicted phage tail protein